MGDGTPWTQERRTRPQKVMYIEGEKVRVAYDRSSAHVAAWFSPKREPEKVGLHFKRRRSGLDAVALLGGPRDGDVRGAPRLHGLLHPLHCPFHQDLLRWGAAVHPRIRTM